VDLLEKQIMTPRANHRVQPLDASSPRVRGHDEIDDAAPSLPLPLSVLPLPYNRATDPELQPAVGTNGGAVDVEVLGKQGSACNNGTRPATMGQDNESAVE